MRQVEMKWMEKYDKNVADYVMPVAWGYDDHDAYIQYSEEIEKFLINDATQVDHEVGKIDRLAVIARAAAQRTDVANKKHKANNGRFYPLELMPQVDELASLCAIKARCIEVRDDDLDAQSIACRKPSRSRFGS